MQSPNSWELRRRWQSQIGAKKLLPTRRRRHTAGIGFLCQGWRPQEFVELSRLIIVAVYDSKTAEGTSAIRVAGYRPQVTSEGVEWCCAKKAILWKDLLLRPKPFAKTQRIDLRSGSLLQLALRLEHRIEQAERHPRRIERTTLRFPRLWAGFRRSDFHSVESNGPEIEALCDKFGLTRQSMTDKFVREHDGLMLLPAFCVADALHSAKAVFAEISRMPYRQAIELSSFKERFALTSADHEAKIAVAPS
jgi:hypothetical protein